MSFAPQASAFMVFFAAALVIALTPGPGIFYVGARTLAGGREEGMASSFGTGLGGLVHVIAGAIGLSAKRIIATERKPRRCAHSNWEISGPIKTPTRMGQVKRGE